MFVSPPPAPSLRPRSRERGLIAENGISWILPRLVGWGASTDLLLSGRTFFADEAAKLRLIKEVVAPEELMKHRARVRRDLARNCAPSSLAVIKSRLYGDAGDPVVDESARAEELMSESLTRPDLMEGITAFFEKRTPNFPPSR